MASKGLGVNPGGRSHRRILHNLPALLASNAGPPLKHLFRCPRNAVHGGPATGPDLTLVRGSGTTIVPLASNISISPGALRPKSTPPGSSPSISICPAQPANSSIAPKTPIDLSNFRARGLPTHSEREATLELELDRPQRNSGRRYPAWAKPRGTLWPMRYTETDSSALASPADR